MRKWWSLNVIIEQDHDLPSSLLSNPSGSHNNEGPGCLHSINWILGLGYWSRSQRYEFVVVFIGAMVVVINGGMSVWSSWWSGYSVTGFTLAGWAGTRPGGGWANTTTHTNHRKPTRRTQCRSNMFNRSNLVLCLYNDFLVSSTPFVCCCWYWRCQCKLEQIHKKRTMWLIWISKRIVFDRMITPTRGLVPKVPHPINRWQMERKEWKGGEC